MYAYKGNPLTWTHPPLFHRARSKVLHDHITLDSQFLGESGSHRGQQDWSSGWIDMINDTTRSPLLTLGIPKIDAAGPLVPPEGSEPRGRPVLIHSPPPPDGISTLRRFNFDLDCLGECWIHS